MTLETNVSNLATRVATEAKALRILINNNSADLSALQTTAKTNLVAAINELVGSISGAGASINDATTSSSSVWSSEKTDSEIAAAVSALVDSAPGTLDTLNELAAALGDDPDFATTITNLIGDKAADNAVVKLTGAQTVAGVKTFSDSPVVPDASFSIAKTSGLQSALDGKASTTAASESAAGIVELATTAEATTGTDTTRAVTAAGVRAVTGDPDTNFVTAFEAGLS